MWWRLFQALIVFAVIASNIHYGWTPNGYLAAIYGGMAAFGATYLLTALLDLRAKAPAADEARERPKVRE